MQKNTSVPSFTLKMRSPLCPRAGNGLLKVTHDPLTHLTVTRVFSRGSYETKIAQYFFIHNKLKKPRIFLTASATPWIKQSR